MFSETLLHETVFAVASPEAWRRSASETILLVEDQAFVRQAVAEILESAGYQLVVAGSAAEALCVCGATPKPLDLLLADVVMPGISGRELAAQLEGFYPRTRVLLMSGYAEQLARSDSSLYCEEYLAKPFSVGTLLRRVREVLEKPASGGRA